MPRITKKRKVIEIEGVCVIRYVSKFDRWELDAGLKFGGKSKYRKQFKKLDEARLHAEQLQVKLKNEGISGFSLSREEQVDAQQALSILNSKATLTQACEYFMRFNNLTNPTKQFPHWLKSLLITRINKECLGKRVLPKEPSMIINIDLGYFVPNLGLNRLTNLVKILSWIGYLSEETPEV